jgi:hypothetical protein
MILQPRDVSANINATYHQGIGTTSSTVNLLSAANAPIFFEYDNIRISNLISLFSLFFPDAGKYFTANIMAPFVFCNKPFIDVISTGMVAGGMQFDGKEQIKITSTSSACDAVFIYYCYARVATIENGHMTTTEDAG